MRDDQNELGSSPGDATSQIRFAAWVGLVANLALSAVKLAAGLVGNSEAVVADAFHSLSDVVTDVALLLGVRYWTAPADERHPHGHRRIETLITVVIGLALGGVAVGIAVNAIKSLGAGGSAAPGPVALGAAVLSIISKEWLFRWTRGVARRTDSSALEANAWHHRSDAMSSLPAAVAVLISIVVPGWAFVDLIGALVVCHFIFFAAVRIMRPALGQLVDEGAPEPDREIIENLALAVPGVRSAHALRTRYVGSELAVDLHVEVNGNLSVTDGYKIARLVRNELITNGPKVADVMVQIEPFRGEN